MDDWTPDGLSVDEAYKLVSEGLRRETLRVLLNEREQWEVNDLATAVAAREQNTSPADIGETIHKRIVVALMHRDLPKLADADIVAFDFEAETVTPSSNIDDLEELL